MLPSRSGISLWAIYRNYPSIIVIKNKKKIIQVVPFPVIYDDVLKEIKTLDTAEASQQSDVATKIVKQDSDYFAEYFYENINQCILTWIFPPHLESRSNNKKLKNSKDNPMFLKFTKDVSIIKFSSFSILHCPNIDAVFVKVTTHTLLDNSNWEMEGKCWQWRCIWCITYWFIESFWLPA